MTHSLAACILVYRVGHIYNVYDRIFGEFPAKNTVYTPYIYGSGQPYLYSKQLVPTAFRLHATSAQWLQALGPLLRQHTEATKAGMQWLRAETAGRTPKGRNCSKVSLLLSAKGQSQLPNAMFTKNRQCFQIIPDRSSQGKAGPLKTILDSLLTSH